MVGLVGHTGSGKSSLMNLLLRFYDLDDPLSDRIYIDGVDIQNIPKRAYCEHIGIVLQDPVLFKGTIASNIRLNKSNVSDEEITRVLIEIGGERIIKKFADGINHPITRAGVNLSAGEKQIIVLARVIIHDVLLVKSVLVIAGIYVHHLSINRVINMIARDGRTLAMKNIERLPISMFEAEPAGKKALRIATDIDGLINLYRLSVSIFSAAILNFIFAYVGMFYLDKRLALLSFDFQNRSVKGGHFRRRQFRHRVGICPVVSSDGQLIAVKGFFTAFDLFVDKVITFLIDDDAPFSQDHIVFVKVAFLLVMPVLEGDGLSVGFRHFDPVVFDAEDVIVKERLHDERG